jgi:hypothetical protein
MEKQLKVLKVQLGKGSKVRTLENDFLKLFKRRKATHAQMALAFADFMFLRGDAVNMERRDKVAKARKDGGRTDWCIGYPPKAKAAKAGN